MSGALALASLLTSIATTFLGIFVLYRNPRNDLNRTFFLFCLSGAMLAFFEFGYRQAETLARASFWLKGAALGYAVISFQLHFVLLFTGRRRLLDRRAIYLLLYGPALLFLLLNLTTPTTVLEPVGTRWGWTYRVVEPDTAYRRLLLGSEFLWVLGALLAIAFLCLRYYFRARERGRKVQTLYILVGMLLPTALAVITGPGRVNSVLGVGFPELGSLGFVAECMLLWHAMWRHELFALTPERAAEDILSTVSEAVLLVSPEGKMVALNPATSELLGCKEGELIGQPLEMILAQSEKPEFATVWLEQLASTGSIGEVETVFVSKDGGEKPFSLSGSVMRRGGIEQGIVFVARDLTERKRVEKQLRASLEEKEVLLREIHHRVKNNLQVISSLLGLQSGYIDDRRAIQAFQESQGRIRSMALIHEKLYQSQDLARVSFAEYIHSLADYLFRSYGVDRHLIALRVGARDILLDVDVAVQCGLVVNELLSNSLKHAFPNGRRGEIRVDLHLYDESKFVLTVRDNGVGFPDDVDFWSAETLGLQLVSALARQLGGAIEFEEAEGTEVKVSFTTE